MQITAYRTGAFCWVDLATTDVNAAQDFYTALFGWGAKDVRAREGRTYRMLDKDGDPVCGLRPASPTPGVRDAVPGWRSYVSVASVDPVAERVAGLGGRVAVAPVDVLTAGRMAVVEDPAGGSLALWEPRGHHGASRLSEPGAPCWHELQTGDLAAAGPFYKGLLGWTAETSSTLTGRDYTVFVNAGAPAAGMLKTLPQWRGAAPGWVVYFAVQDCDATVDEAVSLGGELLVPATDLCNVGRFAFLRDPQGAVFAVVRLDRPPA